MQNRKAVVLIVGPAAIYGKQMLTNSRIHCLRMPGCLPAISYNVIYSYADSCWKNHNDTILKTREGFFKTIYLSLYLKGSKGLFKVLGWEGVGDRTELQYIDPHSYGHQRCVFLVLQGCSTGGLGADSAGFLYCILSPTGLVPKLHRESRGPLLLGGGFPYYILSPTHLISNSPSYIIVQSPTQSLEWHIWSSSSGNNSHSVQRSLSSGASVYECIMGFYLVPFDY